MEKKLPEFKPLPELGNVANNYISAFNVGMNIYDALSYLQGYVLITYNSVNDMVDEWNKLGKYVTDVLNQWLEDGTVNELIATNPQWDLKVNKAGDMMSGDLQFQENTGVYGTLNSGDKANMISHSYVGSDDYIHVGDSKSQTVVQSKSRPVWNDGSQNQDLLVVEDLSPKENLLINADFKNGIINQRGKPLDEGVAYTGSSYAIDRWRVDKLKVTTYDDYLRIDNEDITSHSLTQPFLKPIKEKCTWYINIKDMSEDCYAWTYVDDSGKYNNVGYLSKGENVFVYGNKNQPTLDFSISIPPGGFIEIYQMKLEKGTVFTGMPEWDYMNEWNNCRRFYKEIRVTAINTNPTNITQPYYMIPYTGDVPMVKKPRLANADQEGFVFSWNGTSEPDLKIKSLYDVDTLTNTPVRIELNQTSTQAILQTILKLDAEI